MRALYPGLGRHGQAPGRHGRRTHDKRCPRNRSEEHTSELQSQSNLVCRLLLEKKKKILNSPVSHANIKIYDIPKPTTSPHQAIRYYQGRESIFFLFMKSADIFGLSVDHYSEQ